MHLGAAERLVVALLAGRHLDQGWAAEEDLGLLLDHHGVVAHAGDVGAAGRGVAKDQRDRRLLARAGAGDVAEGLAARDEDLLLRGQVGTTGLHERDRRQAVLLGDLCGAEGLLDRPRVAGAALDRGVVGGDDALDALDHADAGDDARPDGEVGAPAGERAELEEGAAGVDEQLDALARQQLPAAVVALDVLLPAAGDRLGVLGVERLELVEHRRPVAAHASSTAFIRSSVVRMPRWLVRRRR